MQILISSGPGHCLSWKKPFVSKAVLKSSTLTSVFFCQGLFLTEQIKVPILKWVKWLTNCEVWLLRRNKGSSDLSKNGGSSKIYWTVAHDQVLRGGRGGRKERARGEVHCICTVSEYSFLFINKPQQCYGTLEERLAFNCEVASGIGHIIPMGRRRRGNITVLQNMIVNLFKVGGSFQSCFHFLFGK